MKSILSNYLPPALANNSLFGAKLVFALIFHPRSTIMSDVTSSYSVDGVAQRQELAAHTRVVLGSNPSTVTMFFLP